MIAPHTSTYEVWLPDVLHQWTDTIDIYDVWTLHPHMTWGLYPRLRVLYLQSAIPYEAMNAGFRVLMRPVF